MKLKLLLCLTLAGLTTGLLAGSARAEVGLQLNPLKYEDQLTTDHIKSGFIDVANPADTTVTIRTDVQGFRQVNLEGDLQFFPDDRLRSGITPGLTEFQLGPRESIRVTFSVDPAKLPSGGVYAAIFFRTLPPPPAVDTGIAYITESANVGTLLILQNGAGRPGTGRLVQVQLPFWQWGRGLAGAVQYQNGNSAADGLAFNPRLASRALPWSRSASFTGPFIMPGNTRQFAWQRPGAFLGLLPVTLTDTLTGARTTRWVLACTGWWRWLAPLLLFLLALGLLPARWFGLAPRRPTIKRPLDGLSRKT